MSNAWSRAAKAVTCLGLLAGMPSDLAHATASRPRVVVGLPQAVTHLNPFAATTIDGYRMIGLIFEPLARIDPDSDRLVPWLAASWRVLPSERGVRVELRPNLSFQDGTALTSADVKFTLEAFRRPQNRAATWLPLWRDVKAVRIIDARTFEFTSDHLTYDGFSNVMTSLRILPRHRPVTDLVGSGPFKTPRVSDGKIDFTSHAEWWRKSAPDFDLTFRTVVDARAARELIARGNLDLFGVADDGDAVAAGPGTGVWIDLNLRRKIFSDPRVRRALLMLWNRAELNQKIFAGARQLAVDTFDPNHVNYPPGRLVDFDPQGALKLLRLTGWRASEHQLIRAGEPLGFEVLVGDATEDRLATLWQSTLRKNGIKLTVTRAPRDDAWWRRMARGEFDAAVGSGALATRVNAATWSSQGAFNPSGIRDQALDLILGRLDHEFDSRRRAHLERRAIARAREARAQLPGLIAPRGRYLKSKRLQIDTSVPDEIWRWRITPVAN